MPDFDSEPPLIPAPVLRAPEPPATNALIGPLGLRAGWGILLFFVIAILLITGLGLGLLKATGRNEMAKTAARQARLAAEQAKAAHRPATPAGIRLYFSLITETSQAAGVLLTAFGISFLERRRFSVYGLRTRYARDLLPGALWGLVSMSALVGALRALHLLVFDGRLLHGKAVVGYGFGWLIAFLLVGIFEEFVFRGYIQFTLTRGLLGLAEKFAPGHTRLAAFWISAIFWSLLFLLAHVGNSGESPIGLVSVFCAGILFSYALWRTGSLWWGIGFHMTWDWAQSFLFGVPDSGTLALSRLFATHPAGRPVLSGGIDGPEGSVLGMAVFLLMLIVIRLHPQAEQPPVEPESLPPVLYNAEPEPIA